MLFCSLTTLPHSTLTAVEDPSKTPKSLPKFWKWSEKKKLIQINTLVSICNFGYISEYNVANFLYQISWKDFVKMWYLIFCWGANRGCGGSSCNKILGIHNNRTKLPTKSQRKPKRWKINWSISASLQKLPRPPCSNSDEICSKKMNFQAFSQYTLVMSHDHAPWVTQDSDTREWH